MVQVQEAWDHGYDMIEPDVGGVVEELKRLDPSLGVRLGTRHHERAWVIFRKHCPVHPDYPKGMLGLSAGLGANVRHEPQSHPEQLRYVGRLDARDR